MKASDFLLTGLGEMGTLSLAHSAGSSMDTAVMNFLPQVLVIVIGACCGLNPPTGWYGEFHHRTAHLNDATS